MDESIAQDTPVAGSATSMRDLAIEGTFERPLTVLCVDDEPFILASLQRALRSPEYRIVTASSGAEGLAKMRESAAEVVISDMRMPGMDGAQFLEEVRDGWPATIRILLTGHADMSTAIVAINRGEIYRYLNKPWDESELRGAVMQGLERIALQRDKERLEELTLAQNLELRTINDRLEQRVLERTNDLGRANKRLKQNFLTSIKAFSNMIELRGGPLIGHGRRVANVARTIAQAMHLDEPMIQDVFIAALLHDIGHIALPDAFLARPVARLRPEELAQYRQHPLLGEQVLMPLEDMQNVATIIRDHHERHDGQGYPDGKAGSEIALGARILAIADTYDELQNGHLGGARPNATEARVLLQQGRGSQFDPDVIDVFLQASQAEQRRQPDPLHLVATRDLVPGMVLAGDLLSPQGVLLLVAGHVLTDTLIRRIQQFENREGQAMLVNVRRRPI
jgi:response regulator RpfG family c-di-GMP phosphodiesterase